jgi:hypothetical protein
MGNLPKNLYTFMTISRPVHLRVRNIPDKIIEKIKICVFCLITCFFLENSVIYEIMWKNIVQPDRSQVKKYGAFTLQAGYLRLPTHTQNM